MNQTGLGSLRGGRIASVTFLLSSLLGLAALGGCDGGPVAVDTGDLPDDAPLPEGGTFDAGQDAGEAIDGGEADGGVIDDDCTGRVDGAVCVLTDMADRRAICLSEACVVSTCGDGVADTTGDHPSGVAASETCDDGNTVGGDGCEDDCTFSCDAAADCPDDTDVCNGVPACSADHICASEPAADDTACVLDLSLIHI